MLSDHERRSLDATAALLALDDPVLAARLRQHRIGPERRERQAWQAWQERQAWRGRRARRLPAAAWPPLIMITLCLALLLAPSLMGSPERRTPVYTDPATAPSAPPSSARPPSGPGGLTTVAHRSPPVTAPSR